MNSAAHHPVSPLPIIFTMQFRHLVFVLFIVTRALSASVKSHDSFVPFPASGGPLETAYQPQLHIGNGCHSYPAVNAQGDWSGGLYPSGSPSAGCSDPTKGQTYVRSTNNYKGRIAMVYCWYMPKDEPVPTTGHRHEWEGAVVFLDIKTHNIDGVATSAHGHWRKYYNPNGTNVDGTHVKVEYSAEGLNSHAIRLTDKDGDLPNLAQWDRLGGPAQQAINNPSNWGAANPPIAQMHYQMTLEGAWMW